MKYQPTVWKTGDIVTADRLNHAEEGIANAGVGVVETTWAELKSLRDGGELVPGTQYRITDYICTVDNDVNARVESHPYDIIVTADSETLLNENARAVVKDGDTYYRAEGYNDAVLEAWELKYCLDNDSSRFGWADTVNGKGVVYFLRDDRQNECWYDFKQIKLKRYKITAYSLLPSMVGKYTAYSGHGGMTVDKNNPEWLYTFSYIDENNQVLDGSIVKRNGNDVPQNNKIGKSTWVYFDEDDYNEYIMAISNNVFVGNCKWNTIGDNCKRNTFGTGCDGNIFFGENVDNTFGEGCTENIIKSGGQNILGDGCCANTIDQENNLNIFKDRCCYNVLGEGCVKNTFGNEFCHNYLKRNCKNNKFGDECHYNQFGIECSNNTFGVSCDDNILGDECNSISLESICSYNRFGFLCHNIHVSGYCFNNTVGPNCAFLKIQNYSDEENEEGYAQYYNILSVVAGTDKYNEITIRLKLNNDKSTYIGYDSSGELKYWNPMDDAQ